MATKVPAASPVACSGLHLPPGTPGEFPLGLGRSQTSGPMPWADGKIGGTRKAKLKKGPFSAVPKKSTLGWFAPTVRPSYNRGFPRGRDRLAGHTGRACEETGTGVLGKPFFLALSKYGPGASPFFSQPRSEEIRPPHVRESLCGDLWSAGLSRGSQSA